MLQVFWRIFGAFEQRNEQFEFGERGNPAIFIDSFVEPTRARIIEKALRRRLINQKIFNRLNEKISPYRRIARQLIIERK